MILIALALALAIPVAIAQTFTASVDSSSANAGTTTQHFLALSFTNYSLPAAAYFTLTYTPGWTVSTATKANNGDYCQTGCTLAAVTASVSSNSIRIDNLFPYALINSYFGVGISLQNVVNPKVAITDTLILAIYNSANIQLASTPISVSVNPSPMTCTATPTNLTVTATTPYLFTITPSLTLDSTGSLEMVFPSNWMNSASGSALAYSSCSNTGNTISCSPSGSTVTATGLFSGTTSSPFSFTLANVVNPGSLESNSQLFLTYKLANGSKVSTCSVTISGLQSTSISNVAFSIAANIGTLSFSNLLAPLITDQLLLTFSSEYYLGDVENVVEKINGTSQYNLEPTKATGANQIILNPFKDQYLDTFAITISNVYLTYPTTAPLTLTFQRYGHPYSAHSLSYSLPPANSLTATPSLASPNMNTNTDYSTTLQLHYPNVDHFLLDFCPQFGLTPAQTYPCYISSTVPNTGLTCTAANTTQLKVQLTNGSSFSSNLQTNTNYTLTVTGLTNPSQSSCWLKVSSYSAGNNLLEYSNQASLSYTATKMLEATLTVSNPAVAGTSTYSLVVNNTNPLTAGDQLHVYFPNTYTLASVSCTLDSIANTCTLVSSTYLYFDINTNYAQYALAAHTFAISGVTNPVSLKPTSSFQLALTHSGNVLQSINDGLVATMTTPTNFTTLTLTPLSLIATTVTSYTFTFTHSLNIPSSSQLQLAIALPSSLTLLSCQTCTNYSSFTIAPSTNSVTMSQVANPEGSVCTSSIVVSLLVDGYLSISDLLNCPAFSPISLPYSVESNSSFLGEPASVNITISSLPFRTNYLVITVPPTYTLNSPTVSSTQLQQSATAVGNTLNLTVTSIEGQLVVIEVEGIKNPTTTPSSSWNLAAYNSQYSLIATSTASVVFSASCGTTCRDCLNTSYCLNCYNNPLVNSLPKLDLSLHTCISACSSLQYQINGVCYNCNANCLTCQLTPTNCTSCNNSYLLTNQCVNACPQSYYNSANTCLPCANHCLVCNSTSCLNCQSGYVLQSNNTCLATCPSGQYNQSNTCAPCPNNCTACNEAGCTACSPGTLLCNIGTIVCLSVCPQGYYLSLNASWCEPCQTPCKSCSINSTLCTRCNVTSSYPNLYQNTCTAACPNYTYPDSLYQCQPCSSPCLQCYSATNCSSCIINYSLYSPLGQCVLTCMSTTVSVAGICQKCLSPCLTCSSSTSTCTACEPGYSLLSNNTCTDTCLPPAVAYMGYCSTCTYPCLSCDSTNSSICLGCAANYMFFSGSCYTSCPTHTYSNSLSTCALCSPPCSECSSTASTCTACYQSAYLYNNQCYNPCPVNFLISSTGACVVCQSQCTSCTQGYSYQCSSCSNPAYYHNPITLECTANCTPPYYPNTATPFQCLTCQLPCKTCSNYYTQCSSCFEGYFLLNSQCLSACPSNYYQNQQTNQCIACPALCASCTALGCSACLPSNYFYAGECYSSCPAPAPYTYGSYCRNCQLTSCLLCDSAGYCTLCEPNYLLYMSSCQSECPADYEADILTNTRCIKKAAVAYSQFIQFRESMKILALPATLVLVLLLPTLVFAQVKLFALAFALSLPQSLALVQFAVLYFFEWNQLETAGIALPQFLGWIAVAAHLAITIPHVCILWRATTELKQFQKWINYGGNSCRAKIVMACSLVNKQSSYLFFSGYFSLPLTSLPFPAPSKPLLSAHLAYTCLDLVLAAVGLAVAVLKQTSQYNSKLFFSAVDLLIVFLFSFVFDIAFACLAPTQPAPKPYQKYILPGVSNRTLPALSDPPEEEEDTHMAGLHRSGSDEDIFQSKEMKEVDFLSAVDLDDFLDDTPLVEDVKDALAQGKFRKKNKKKRGRRRGRNLDVIEEESFQSEEEDEFGYPAGMRKREGKQKGKDRRLRRKKEEQLGGLNNYIYYCKPKEKKKSPAKIFKENEEMIMSRIKEKESEFDTITQNDIIFQEQFDSSSSDDYQLHHQSRRALNRPQNTSYDNLFNLNYAEKHHMGPQ